MNPNLQNHKLLEWATTVIAVIFKVFSYENLFVAIISYLMKRVRISR